MSGDWSSQGFPSTFGSPSTISGISGTPTGEVTAGSDSTVAGFLAVSDTAAQAALFVGISVATAVRFRGYRCNNTAASPAALSGTGGLNQFEGYGYDGSAWAIGASINLRGVGTWSGSGHPSDIVMNVVSSTGTSQVQALQLTTEGSCVLGSAAIATGATDGFLYIVTCSGTPTGAPTANTGRAPLIYDTSANKIWVYNGSWRGVVVT